MGTISRADSLDWIKGKTAEHHPVLECEHGGPIGSPTCAAKPFLTCFCEGFLGEG